VSFLAPLWLAAAGVAALGVLSLHFITTQRPPASPLPTARFVPSGDARASSRAARPTDLLLLLLRCAAVMLLGAAFAGPVTRNGHGVLARVIVVDRSRGAHADTRDSALALLRGAGRTSGADAVIVFDSSATAVAASVDDSSLRALVPTARRGSLSTALVSARHTAGELALRADSIELVIVSPLTADEVDAASGLTIAKWPGRVRLVRTAAAKPVAAAPTLIGGDADDPLRPVVAALNSVVARDVARATVRIVRGAPSAADSAAAHGGAAVVVWPRAGSAAASAEGVWAGTATLVAPLARMPIASGGRVVARWADGAAAAAEWAYGSGCLRLVGIGVPVAGDVALQSAFMAVARALLAPCEGAGVGGAVPDSVARAFVRTGAAASAASLRAADGRSPLAPWLIAGALALLAGELIMRRGAVRASA
jgi:hypothetical protein